jgi:predicted nucleic acid-binding protein
LAVIVVDTSVWIDHLRGTATSSVRRLRALIPEGQILVGDLILCEVLQGLRGETEAILVEATLRKFTLVSLLDPDLAVVAAANYRHLRRTGITIRKTIDLIIGTFCIERGHALLHSDRDFEPMERFLGLRTV